MCNLLAGAIVCVGALGHTSTLDAVAERRYNAEWGVTVDPANYYGLIGVQNCAYVGKVGWLVTGDRARRVLVADCNTPSHFWPSGYLGDISIEALNCRKGYLVLRQ